MYMTQTNRNALVISVGLAMTVLTLAVFKLFNPTWNHMVDFGKTSVDIALLAFLGVQILFGLAYLLFVIQGFRTHWGWGVANMILPFAALIFFFTHPKRSKAPVLVYVSGLALMGLTMIWTKIR